MMGQMNRRDPCGSRGSKSSNKNIQQYSLGRDPCGSRGSKYTAALAMETGATCRDPCGSRGSKSLYCI